MIENLTVHLKGISKRFGKKQALEKVDFELKKGEIHAIVGENGAGKTTLVNCLFGMIQPDEGEITINGIRYDKLSPRLAVEAGVGMVHQHFKLIPEFTVAENVFLGQEIIKNGIVQEKLQNRRIEELSKRYGLEVDPLTPIYGMSVGMRQRVEILRALSKDIRVLVLDEPTAVLTPNEVDQLFEVLRKLVADGLSIIFISHHLHEIMRIADRITVLRSGKKHVTELTTGLSELEIARLIIGRDQSQVLKHSEADPGDVVLRVEDVLITDSRGAQTVKGVSFNVREGEVVGLAGVAGNGQSELAEAIIGMRKVDAGRICYLGQDITNISVSQLREKEIGVIPEDRLQRGVNPYMTIAQNIYTGSMNDESYGRIFLKLDKIEQHAMDLVKEYDIRGVDDGTFVGELSGGNIQKVVLARELSSQPKLVIASEPSRGLDIGATEFVHKQLLELRNNRSAVFLLSTELEEVLSLSDRILIIHGGRIMSEFDRHSIPDEAVLSAFMLGVENKS
ncbi:MAG: ABC transporter ATP-binding protein [Chloroflexi bacterium]|nr:ABC transporter ATP-binding protein [Chloroflexota bacterium]